MVSEKEGAGETDPTKKMNLIKQREGSRFVVLEPAKTRIKENKCPSCSKPKKEWTRRKDWTCCSTECTEKYIKDSVYLSWGDLRDKVLKRDNWTCVKCGKQPTTTRYNHSGFIDGSKMVLDEYKHERGVKAFTVIDKSSLVADHIFPIALGGDEWDIDNIQTLCSECNKIKTREDIGKIAELRRIGKTLSNGQTQLAELNR